MQRLRDILPHGHLQRARALCCATPDKETNDATHPPADSTSSSRDGYLFFPGQFSADETRVLTDAVPELYSRREVYNVREKGSDAVRTNFAAHLISAPFARLARHPRMVQPVMDLLGEELYMHQFKINGKMAFEGDVWQWHQDYGTWLNDDLMPTERAMNVAIFLDDVNEFNGPLMFIPGSHRQGRRSTPGTTRAPPATRCGRWTMR